MGRVRFHRDGSMSGLHAVAEHTQRRAFDFHMGSLALIRYLVVVLRVLEGCVVTSIPQLC